MERKYRPEASALHPRCARRRCPGRAGALVCLALAAGGCGGGEDAEGPADETRAAGPLPAVTGPAPDTARVMLAEYSIEMLATLEAGYTVFAVTNSGTQPHNFQIEGPGVEQAFPNVLPPGTTGTYQVDLQPGTYQVYCPVDDHRQQGMVLALRVIGTAAPADSAAADSAAADTTAAP
jgi:hypothetical protein